MPFCTQCGHQAAPSDAFCGYCGARQTGSAAGDTPPSSGSSSSAPPPSSSFGPSSQAPDPLSGLTPRTAAILCYIPTIGWIPAVIILAARKFRNNEIVRFHAFQGLYLFAAWLVVSWVVRPLSATLPSHFVRADHVLETILLFVSIFMMVKASHGEAYVLPIVGELAQRSSTEH